MRKLKSEAAKLFSKGLNSAAAAEDSCAAEVRRKQKIQLAQVIFTLLLTVSSNVFLFCLVFLTVAYRPIHTAPTNANKLQQTSFALSSLCYTFRVRESARVRYGMRDVKIIIGGCARTVREDIRVPPIFYDRADKYAWSVGCVKTLVATRTSTIR